MRFSLMTLIVAATLLPPILAGVATYGDAGDSAHPTSSAFVFCLYVFCVLPLALWAICELTMTSPIRIWRRRTLPNRLGQLRKAATETSRSEIVLARHADKRVVSIRGANL